MGCMGTLKPPRAEMMMANAELLSSDSCCRPGLGLLADAGMVVSLRCGGEWLGEMLVGVFRSWFLLPSIPSFIY